MSQNLHQQGFSTPEEFIICDEKFTLELSSTLEGNQKIVLRYVPDVRLPYEAQIEKTNTFGPCVTALATPLKKEFKGSRVMKNNENAVSIEFSNEVEPDTVTDYIKTMLTQKVEKRLESLTVYPEADPAEVVKPSVKQPVNRVFSDSNAEEEKPLPEVLETLFKPNRSALPTINLN